MSSRACRHKYLETIGELTCCLACGEIIDETATSNQPALELQKHVYQPLDLKSKLNIRLIVLWAGSYSSPIRCSIEHVSLQQKLDYCAISYTWATEDGDDRKSEQVEIDGTILHVTKNCHAALRRLRTPYNSRTIWIDSICIDQANVQERNHQVGLMESIYKMASVVYICIHDPGNSYVECIRWLHQDAHPSVIASAQLTKLLQLRYFSRVWVIQEGALARRVVLTVNESSVPLSGDTLSVLYRACHQLKIRVPGPLEWIASRRSVASLISCLRVSMKATTTDPRDKIYGILSLLEPSIRQMIPIDYSSAMGEVMSYAIMACIAVSNNLAVLSYAWLSSGDGFTAPNFGEENFRLFLSQALPLDIPPQFRDVKHGPWVSYTRVEGTTCGMVTEDSQGVYEPSVVEYTSPVGGPCLMIPRLKVRAHLIDRSTGATGITARDLTFAFPALIKDYDPTKAEILKLFRRKRYHNVRLAFDAESENSSGSGIYSDNERDGTRCRHEYDKDSLNAFFSDIRKATEWESRAVLHKSSSSEIDRSRNTSPESLTGIRPTYKNSGAVSPRNHIFFTNYSVGFTSVPHLQGDAVFAVDGVRYPLLLREVGPAKFRIVGICYLWAALELDYWNPGTHKGLWPDRPVDMGSVQTRMIELY